MNERIRELVEQAQDWADDHAPFASEEHEYFAEKFALLIVQDCVNVLQDNGMWNSRVSDVLDKHFGVEE